jgi:hypothetical protein
MKRTPNIGEQVWVFYEATSEAHGRSRSWEHCFQYFRKSTPEALLEDRHHAALQLGFYLASWGMYRGSSFLLQHDYTIHIGVIRQLVLPRFSVLWRQKFGASENDTKLVPLIGDAFSAVREAYRPFAPRAATDTLVTKILLATFGCLPACDRFFVEGFKSAGFKYSSVDSAFISRVLRFCRGHIRELHEGQRKIEDASGMRYPLMKLVDMYFHEAGAELA